MKSEIFEATILFKMKDQIVYDVYVVDKQHHFDMESQKAISVQKILLKNNRVLIYLSNDTLLDVSYDDNIHLKRRKINDE